MVIPAWGLALLLLHPSSVSRSELWVSDYGIALSMRVQLATWEEVFPDLDANGDGALSQAELAPYQERMRAYVATHYVLRAEEDSPAIEPRLLKARPYMDSSARQSLLREWVDLDFEYRAGQVLSGVLIESNVFTLGSPDHIDVLTAHLRGGVEAHYKLSAAEPLARIGSFPALDRRSGMKRGLRGGMSNFALPAFLLAAFLAGLRLGGLMCIAGVLVGVQLLAFIPVLGELAGALEQRGLLSVGEALLVAYVCTQTLLKPESDRSLWVEALLMGLLHALTVAAVEWNPRANGSVWSMAGHQFVYVCFALGSVVLLGLLRRWASSKLDLEHGGGGRISRVGSGLLALAALLRFGAQF